jgi:DNA-directed RNA polymerase specialized sigma24 family protein
MPRPLDENLGDVYGYLAYSLDSRAAAEDLTRNTFERAGEEGIRVGAGDSRTRLALLGIAHRLARGADHAAGGDHAHPSAPVARALRDLPRRDRAILALRYGARLGAPEAARVLEMSDAEAQRAFSRALRRLRTALEREEREEDEQPEA